MTCIVGVVSGTSVVIGGDSAGVSGTDMARRRDKKVFHNGEFLIGFTSSFRMGQLLRYVWTPPEQAEGQDIMHYMVGTVVPSWRRVFSANGYGQTINGEDRGGEFLVGYRGRLFLIDTDFQVGEHVDGIASVGCGFAYALGSLHALNGYIGDPRKRVRLALETAERFSTAVSSPLVIESVQ